MVMVMVMVVMRRMTTFTEKAKDRRKGKMGGNEGTTKSKRQNQLTRQASESCLSALLPRAMFQFCKHSRLFL